jgi:hypothetical protein
VTCSPGHWGFFMSAANQIEVLADIQLARDASERLMLTLGGGSAAETAAMVVLAALAADTLDRVSARLDPQES